jgi:hypothetical protein
MTIIYSKVGAEWFACFAGESLAAGAVCWAWIQAHSTPAAARLAQLRWPDVGLECFRFG